MNQGKFIVTCPICGKTLFKSACNIGCAIDVQCTKCGSLLNIKISNHILSVREQL